MEIKIALGKNPFRVCLFNLGTKQRATVELAQRARCGSDVCCLVFVGLFADDVNGVNDA